MLLRIFGRGSRLCSKRPSIGQSRDDNSGLDELENLELPELFRVHDGCGLFFGQGDICDLLEFHVMLSDSTAETFRLISSSWWVVIFPKEHSQLAATTRHLTPSSQLSQE